MIRVILACLCVAAFAAGGIAADYGTGNGTVFALTLPEPGTLVLLAAGAIGLVGYVWRCRRATKTATPSTFEHEDDAPAILSFTSHASTAHAARRAA